MYLIFNELSVNDDEENKSNAEKRFTDFIEVYSNAVKNGFQREIITYENLNTILVAKNYSVSQWRNQKVDRDLLRRFKGI